MADGRRHAQSTRRSLLRALLCESCLLRLRSVPGKPLSPFTLLVCLCACACEIDLTFGSGGPRRAGHWHSGGTGTWLCGFQTKNCSGRRGIFNRPREYLGDVSDQREASSLAVRMQDSSSEPSSPQLAAMW